MTELVQRAINYAISAHGRIDHRRKYSGQPYDTHLKSVAEIVSSVTDDESCIAAAWLHDTVEDTPATFADLEREFGAEVSQLVRELTDISKPSDGNRAARKALDREHLSQASAKGKTIKLADIIDNCRDISRHDPSFAKIYLFEARSLLAVLKEGNAQLLKRAENELERCAHRLGIKHQQFLFSDTQTQIDHMGFLDSQKRVLRLFTEAFTAKDIAEPLRSFDSDADAGYVLGILENNDLTVAGLRSDGLVDSFVRIDDLHENPEALVKKPFLHGQVVSADASLSEVILVLTRYENCFVKLLDSVDAVIRRADIQKPVARMWLFGVITMMEMNLAERIRANWPDGSWCQFLSKGRLKKAEELYEERRRRNQHTDLVDCLQIPDKVQVLMSDDEQLEVFGFKTRSAVKKVIKEVESLRNNLAHAQDIVTYDWPQIARMTQGVESLLNQ